MEALTEAQSRNNTFNNGIEVSRNYGQFNFQFQSFFNGKIQSIQHVKYIKIMWSFD